MDKSELVNLKAPSELTIYNVKSFQEDLINKLGSNSDIHIDCQQIEIMDGAGIQLLLSLEKTALNENLNVKFINLTSEFREKIDLAGMTELLDFVEGEENNEQKNISS
jgi:anti-anti-sigma factor